jgi:hypothetical protein
MVVVRAQTSVQTMAIQTVVLEALLVQLWLTLAINIPVVMQTLVVLM